jgi:hypothetical protein|tara:strand:- start:491 stop:934 length:444 start_codon:yes stop_codon:yes gene_type:complete
MKKNGRISVMNRELGALQAALRECGGTQIPMRVALNIVEVQRQIQARIDDVNDINKGLVEQHGTPAEGEEVAIQVSDKMEGWPGYVEAFNELMAAEMYFDEPFVLYEREDSYGWAPNGSASIELSANTIFDLGEMLTVNKLKDSDKS